jgi:sugar lactone lactonase YvrE
MLRIAFATAITILALLAPAAPAGEQGQRTIALPDEFRPEGIASGPKDSFYVGSIPQGSVYRGSYSTGEGEVLVPPHPGRNHIGLKVDRRHDLLFVAGGESKGIYVYDADTGADIASFELPDAGFVNDVVLTRRAAYFTDSVRPVLYAVERDMSSFEELELRGFKPRPDFDLNGIVDARRGRTLIAVQGNVGVLWRIDPESGKSRKIRLGGDKVVNGDGLLLRGRKLYVVQNQDNRIAVVRLERNLKSGEVVRKIRDDDFDVPTTIAAVGRSLYVANARFGTDPTPDTEYWLTRVER